MATIYFDLDGTLIDVRNRHYAAYADAIRSLGLAPLGEASYWQRRRGGASSAELTEDEAARARFLEGFIERIEQPSYLSMDEIIPGAIEALDALHASYALVLVTLRRHRAALHVQLARLGLAHRFDAVLSPGREGASKASLIRAALLPSDGSIVVGDSEADVETARTLRLTAICVTTGVRDRTFLRALAPDLLIDSVMELPMALDARPVAARGAASR